MASPQTLQPVLKMKVDELFLFWLSEPSTQAMLKDYLNKIKNGEEIDLRHADFKGTSTLVLTENNNNIFASKINVTERMTAALGAPCSPPSATLPSASGSNNRAGVNARALRRSVSTKKQAQAKKEEPVTPALSESIPKFYFPQGQPQANINIDNLISKIEKIFSQFPDERVTIKDMGLVAKACECPLYWKAPLFHAAGGDRRGYVSVHKFVAMWRNAKETCMNEKIKSGDVLGRVKCNKCFFCQQVVQRIFYNVNRSWTGKITCSELRRSSFLQNVALLEEEEEINQLTEFFSYEHFYVIYCKFWELDTDHDLYIDQRDLMLHNDQAWARPVELRKAEFKKLRYILRSAPTRACDPLRAIVSVPIRDKKRLRSKTARCQMHRIHLFFSLNLHSLLVRFEQFAGEFAEDGEV
uniref:Serine/threonine-protein phosphatase 2A regulatory subunit B'' subunit beta-like n=1 Tax=Sinocyclocheilus rhinocerous TaxID=307959 RepID=A0A673KPA0_9TELE